MTVIKSFGRLRMIRSLTVAAAVACMAAPLMAQRGAGSGEGHDWPNYRGPQHDGISRERGWVKDWPEDGPPVLWRGRIGTGFSSMAVVGDRVYSMGNRSGRETVYCLDTESGELVWEHSYPAGLVDRMHEGGPSATPTVHEGWVYTLGKEGRVFCLDAADGEVIWEADLGEAAGLEEIPPWGFASSGLIDGDRVVFQAGPLVAFDRETGDVMWRSKSYPPAYSTPAPIEMDGREALTALNSAGMVVVDASDGEELTFYPWEAPSDTNAVTPIVRNGVAYLSAGSNTGTALVNLEPGEAELIHRGRRSGEAMSNHLNTPVLYEGYLYGFDGNSTQSDSAELVCMEMETGQVVWREGDLGFGALIVSDGQLVILTDDGHLMIADATPEGYRERSRARVLEGKCWTTPVLSHGRIYARNNGRGDLVCVDVRGE